MVFVRVFGKEIIIRGFPMNLYLTADRKFKGYTGSGRDVRLHCTDNHPVICIASKSSLADMGYVFPNLQSADLHFCPAVIVVTVGQHIGTDISNAVRQYQCILGQCYRIKKGIRQSLHMLPDPQFPYIRSPERGAVVIYFRHPIQFRIYGIII